MPLEDVRLIRTVLCECHGKMQKCMDAWEKKL